MNTEMVETYRYLRDHGKPISERDAADYAAIRAPAPPSRALGKRIRRAQLGLDPRVDRNPPKPQQLGNIPTIEFHKRVIQQLGGSLTIAPKPDEYQRKPLFYHEQNGPIEPQSERERLNSQARYLQRSHMRAMTKMVYGEYQPDMFEIIDNFGSFEAYCKGA